MTTLTMKEEKRLEIIQRVYRGDLTVEQAALVFGVSERQCYRIEARVSKAGAKGVVHGFRQDLFPINQLSTMIRYPDIFSLLLT